jgi:hypothetical protein
MTPADGPERAADGPLPDAQAGTRQGTRPQALWLYAAVLRVPTNIGSGYGALVGVDEMTAGFKKQANWNSYAALATAAAALLQAAAMTE